jgi:putative hydroxymethylpyrimidine transport system substrate-binding protein
MLRQLKRRVAMRRIVGFLARPLVIGVVAVFAMGAASYSVSASVRPDSRHAQKSLTKITVIGEYLLWAGHAPIIAAIQQGYYKTAGLDVNFIAPPTAGDQVKMVARGRATFGLTQTPDVVLSRAAGIDVKIIGRFWNAVPVGLVAWPDSKIRKPRDLYGKKVGILNTPDSLGAWQTLLRTQHLDASKIKVINPGYGGLALLYKHKIDALYGVAASEPSSFKVKTHVNPIFLLFTRYGMPNYPLLVFFATNSYIKDNPAVLQNFMKATWRGIRAIKSNPAILKKAMAYIQTKSGGYAPAEWTQSAKDSLPYFAASPSTDPAVLSKTISWMTTVKLFGKPWLAKKKIQPITNYFTNQFAP